MRRLGDSVASRLTEGLHSVLTFMLPHIGTNDQMYHRLRWDRYVGPNEGPAYSLSFTVKQEMSSRARRARWS